MTASAVLILAIAWSPVFPVGTVPHPGLSFPARLSFRNIWTLSFHVDLGEEN
jgi:hypothetical protein